MGTHPTLDAAEHRMADMPLNRHEQAAYDAGGMVLRVADGRTLRHCKATPWLVMGGAERAEILAAAYVKRGLRVTLNGTPAGGQ